MRAALIYQHATSERGREIAAELNLRIGREAEEKWPVGGPATGIQRQSDVRPEEESQSDKG